VTYLTESLQSVNHLGYNHAMTTIFRDKLQTRTSQRRITDEGYMDLPARIGRIGVQTYLAGELELTDRDPSEVVGIFRPAEEVFDAESLASFELQPVTDGHPPERVTSRNNKKYSVGTSYGKVTHDETYVNASLRITDKTMIDKIGSGKVEVSNGYTADLELVDGETEAGVKYVGIQRNIRGNHIAVVKRGRAGRNVKLSDDETGNTDTVKIQINDVSYDIPDGPAADAVNKLVKDNAKLVADAETANTAHNTELAKKDDKIGKLEKQIKDAEAEKPDIDKLVADQVAFVANVAVVDAEFKVEGKTQAEVKRELVKKHRTDLVVDEKMEDSYVAACFDLLVNDGKATAARNGSTDNAIAGAHRHVANNNQQGGTFTDAAGKTVPAETRSPDQIARDKMIQDNRSAYKTSADK